MKLCNSICFDTKTVSDGVLQIIKSIYRCNYLITDISTLGNVIIRFFLLLGKMDRIDQNVNKL